MQLTKSRDASLLLTIWAIMNFAVSYVLTAIQRKLLQGTHIPIAILGGIGLVWLLRRFCPTSERWKTAALSALVVLFASLTNILFALRELGNFESNLSQTQLQRTYLKSGEIEALEWIRDNSKTDDALQPLPWIAPAGERSIRVSDESIACFAPGLIHRKVFCGHWGETPDHGAKLNELMRFERRDANEQTRLELLHRMKVRYLLFSQKTVDDQFADQLLPIFRSRLPLPPYLKLVHTNQDADVYEVLL